MPFTFACCAQMSPGRVRLIYQAQQLLSCRSGPLCLILSLELSATSENPVFRETPVVTSKSPQSCEVWRKPKYFRRLCLMCLSVISSHSCVAQTWPLTLSGQESGVNLTFLIHVALSLGVLPRSFCVTICCAESRLMSLLRLLSRQAKFRRKATRNTAFCHVAFRDAKSRASA